MPEPKKINEIVRLYLEKLAMRMMSDKNFEKELVPQHDRDFLMRATFDCLMMDVKRTLKNFIVFEEGDVVAEVRKGTGERVKVIDTLIKYFEKLEEYEKCSQLVKLRDLIIENGN